VCVFFHSSLISPPAYVCECVRVFFHSSLIAPPAYVCERVYIFFHSSLIAPPAYVCERVCIFFHSSLSTPPTYVCVRVSFHSTFQVYAQHLLQEYKDLFDDMDEYMQTIGDTGNSARFRAQVGVLSHRLGCVSS